MEYCLTALRMPIGMANTQMNITVVNANNIVKYSRSAITSVTGNPNSNENPRFPVTIWFIHFRYWT